MYAGFNCIFDSFDLPDTSDAYKTVYRGYQSQIRDKIDSFIRASGALDASKMTANWFPAVKADIFISHAHKDAAEAIKVASWLKDTFGLNSFIDSCVWGYGDRLLKLIDDAFCKNSYNENYSYDLRNRSTSHVHMMLSTALAKMLDKTECVLFLNTPNSITLPDTIEQATTSPWIYSEIAMTSLIRRKSPDEHRMKLTKAARFLETMAMMEYQVDLRHLTPLTLENLVSWKQKAHKPRKWGPDALDVMYEIIWGVNGR